MDGNKEKRRREGRNKREERRKETSVNKLRKKYGKIYGRNKE
jgi:hypothetical protein